MSDPAVATPSDLELYLGEPAGSIDTLRAMLILSMAQDLCSTIVHPLPVGARAVVLPVAARAYTNAASVATMGIGSATVGFNPSSKVGGMYLSRADKATLRTLAGRGSAFSGDILPRGVNAVQTVTVAATSGTFRLTFVGATTAPLAYNATPATVQAALNALSSINGANVGVTGSTGLYAVTFVGTLAAYPMPPLLADGTGLAGGTALVTQTVVGVAAPGQNLPPWGYDYYQGSRASLGSQVYGGW